MVPQSSIHTADAYIEQLQANQSDLERLKIQRYFKSGPGEYGEGDTFIGVRMGTVFELTKAAKAMPIEEIEKLYSTP